MSIDKWDRAQNQELYFWTVQNYDLIADHKQYNSFFNDFQDVGDIVAEIGSSPIPVLNIISCKTQIAIDTLMNKYLTLPDNKKMLDGMQCVNANGNDTTLPSDYCDTVLLLNILDHAKDYQLIIEESKRICKVGGHVYIWCDLRSPEQVDDCHPFSITEAELRAYCLSNFKEVKYEVSKGRLEFQTFKGVYTKC